ncbi:MAG: DoxX family protein [Acidobacteriia bacterium]|nr:DoxX family protein [Terriglobia bacterium]
MTQAEKFSGANAPAATLAIRLLVGGVFFLEGIKKFLFVDQWGAGRFARIGIPAAHVMGSFVGGVEITCGFLLLLGLLTRLASIPLLIDITVAIASTKIPLLLKSGFWPMEAEARTDYSMLLGLVFLLLAGAGAWSLDAARMSRREKPHG